MTARTGEPRAPYPRYDAACGWQALLAPRRAAPALAADVDADLAVVGAGYTGIAAAREWARLHPQDRVVLLDASIVGEGSPGRNSGFLLEIALAGDADAGAVDRMARCNALIGATMARLRALVAEHRIDCALVRSGTYRGAATARGVAALRDYQRFLDAARLPYETLDGGTLARRIGTRYYRFGLYSPDCSLVQPAALIRGLADCLPESVRMYERTPVLGIERAASSRWRLQCSNGSVRAPRVVLANNAFAARLGVGAARLCTMYTYAALTAPLPEQCVQRLGSEREWGLLPAHRLGTTLRRTGDGRLLVRSLYGYERAAPVQQIAPLLLDCLVRRFPRLELARLAQPFEHVWSGATGLTRNGAPLFGERRAGLFVSAGCNGGGVVKGTLFGELIARQAAGAAIPDVAALFGAASWMPPAPLRRIGFALAAALERRSAGAER